MVTVKTDCSGCIHFKVCKNIDNAKSYVEKLEAMMNDDGDRLKDLIERDRVDFEVSCKDYYKDASVISPKKLDKLIDPCSPCVCPSAPCVQCMFGYQPIETRHKVAVKIIEEGRPERIAEKLKKHYPDWEKYVSDEEVKGV